MGNYALFPRATFYVQDAEMAFYTGRHAAMPAFRPSVELDDVPALVRLNYEGRLVFVDGAREIVPGISVHRVGGHVTTALTCGFQCLMRRMQDSTSSTGDKARAPISRRASTAVRSQRSAMGGDSFLEACLMPAEHPPRVDGLPCG